MERIIHEIEPVFDSNSKILMLGTIPSPKSRELGFFYGHPRNRFWQVLSAVLECCLPSTIDEKRAMLLENGIALWDVLKSCEIKGASDSSIKDAVPNDFSHIFAVADIKAVFTTGQKAGALYEKAFHEKPIVLPSTSPANCTISIDALVDAYKVILEYL